MRDLSEQTMRALAKQRADRAERTEALWALTAQQRVSAMRRGELTWGQLLEWAKRRPSEVPLINGEFEFIAALTPEVADLDPRRGGR